MKKDPDGLAAMRYAANLADVGMLAAYDTIGAVVSECEI
jgi:Xaa-Pro aminopeptidase